MLSKHTPNYDLSQWERTAALEAQAAQIAKRGNCKFYHGTYRGTGGIVGVGYPNSFTFPWRPELVVIVGNYSLVVMPYDVTNPINYYGSTVVYLTASWNGNTVSWDLIEGTTNNAYLQMNQQNTTYHVFAFAVLS